MKISILGAGWFGLPLGRRLLRGGRADVHGTTTSPARMEQLRAAGLTPHLLTLTPRVEGETAREFFAGAGILVVAFPPGRGTPGVEDQHPRQGESVVEHARDAGIHTVYHISTTGVYGDAVGEIDETAPIRPTRPTAIGVARMEEVLRREFGLGLTIIRPAGLMGWGRHGVHYLAGKRDLPGGASVINAISGEDLVEAVALLIERGIIGGVYNACCDGHPRRCDFFPAEARRLGLPEPHFAPCGEEAEPRIIRAEKIKKALSIEWKHPDPSTIEPTPAP